MQALLLVGLSLILVTFSFISYTLTVLLRNVIILDRPHRVEYKRVESLL